MIGPLASLWHRLRRPAGDRVAGRPGADSSLPRPIESGAGPDRIEADISELRSDLRSELGAVEARLTELVAATRAEVGSSLGDLATSLGGAVEGASDAARAQILQSVAAVAAQLEQLDRERFEEVTLLEGQGAALDRLVEQAEGLEGRLSDEATAIRRAVAEVGRRQEALLTELLERERLRVIAELFPVADGLVESRRAAERLVASLGEGPTKPVKAAPGGSPLAALASRLFGGASSESPAQQEPSAALGPALEAWLEGLRLLDRRLLGVFAREGVEPIPAVGEPFDPRCHLAVAVERPGTSSDAVALPNVVVREERRGYRAGDRVLRPAEVVVGLADRAAEVATDAHSGGSSSQGEVS